MGPHLQWADGVVVRYERNGRPVVAVEGYAGHAASYASGYEVVWDQIRLPRRKTRELKKMEVTLPTIEASPDAPSPVSSEPSQQGKRLERARRTIESTERSLSTGY